MKPLLALSRAIDAVNERLGRLVYWCVLIMVLVSAANAISRYALSIASKAWLELQWYLFSAVFLLCSGYTLLHNEHIRIDVIAANLSRRKQIWIDIFGTFFFLLPIALYMMWSSWPVFMNAWTSGEISGSAGGLIRWPPRLLVPVGFFPLTLRGISEPIKRFAYLRGLDPRAQRHGGRPARHHRAAVRADPRRTRLCRDLRRRAARSDYRRGGRVGDLDGIDLAADHAALRLRPQDRERCHRRLRDARTDHPAEPGADRARRPARALGRRHVRRRDLPRPRPPRPAYGLCSRPHAAVSQIGASAAGRSALAARLEARRPRALRADSAARAHFPGARHDLPRHCDADRGRRDGRHRRARAGAHQPAPELGAAQAGHELDRQADFVRGVHPGRGDRIQPHVPRRERRPVGRAPAHQPARRPDRLSHRSERPDLPARVLPRFLRAGVHHRAIAGARRGQA